MTSIFDPALVETHHLYHAKAGVGAVIAAIPKAAEEEAGENHRDLGLHVACFFNARVPKVVGTAPDFQRIKAIREEAGFVHVTLHLQYLDPDGADFAMRWAEVDRAIPAHHVALEIIRTDRQ